MFADVTRLGEDSFKYDLMVVRVSKTNTCPFAFVPRLPDETFNVLVVRTLAIVFQKDPIPCVVSCTICQTVR